MREHLVTVDAFRTGGRSATWRPARLICACAVTVSMPARTAQWGALRFLARATSPEPIAPAVSAELLATEIDRLAPDALLLENGPWAVYCAGRADCPRSLVRHWSSDGRSSPRRFSATISRCCCSGAALAGSLPASLLRASAADAPDALVRSTVAARLQDVDEILREFEAGRRDIPVLFGNT